MQAHAMVWRTLALREWMQNRRAWLVMVAVPAAVVLMAIIYGTIKGTVIQGTFSPTALFTFISGGYTSALVALACGVALIVSLGLARRDVQDRSIEFWLSLPIGHTSSVVVPIAMLLIGLPFFVLGISGAASLVFGLLLVIKSFGFAGLGQLEWGTLLALLMAFLPRLMLGVVMSMLWLSPLVMLGMAASAWLKRWGWPITVAFVLGGAVAFNYIYEITAPLQWLDTVFKEAGAALIIGASGSIQGLPHPDNTSFDVALRSLPGLLWADSATVLQGMLRPMFLVGLVIAAGGVYLQCLRRSRGG